VCALSLASVNIVCVCARVLSLSLPSLPLPKYYVRALYLFPLFPSLNMVCACVCALSLPQRISRGGSAKGEGACCYILLVLLRSYYWCCYHGGSAGWQCERGRGACCYLLLVLLRSYYWCCTTADQQGGSAKGEEVRAATYYWCCYAAIIGVAPRRISRAAVRKGKRCVLLPRRISRTAVRKGKRCVLHHGGSAGRHSAISRAAVRKLPPRRISRGLRAVPRGARGEIHRKVQRNVLVFSVIKALMSSLKFESSDIKRARACNSYLHTFHF
jgi:hypothetical protein